jgi:hypothetical protein
LCEVHALGPKHSQALFVFDALCDRLETECPRQADNCLDDVEVVGVGHKVADELESILRCVMGSFLR